MAKHVGMTVYGINTAGQEQTKPFDHFCPLMATAGNPKGFNYWKENCKYRQTLKWLAETCYPKCHGISTVKRRARSTMLSVLESGEEFAKMVDQGMSIASVADETGYSESTIRRYIQMFERGVRKKKRKTYATEAKNFYHLKTGGMSIGEIARKYNISITTVKKYAKEYELRLEAA